MWNLLIYDDDKNFLNEIKEKVIGVCGDLVGRIGTFYNDAGFEFYSEDVDESHPCVAIINVELGNGINGVDVAKKLREINSFTQIIFMSEYDKYHTGMYDVEHTYYLKKPIDEDRLRTALERADKNLQKIQSRLLPIVTRNSTVAIPVDEIIYLEKNRRKINVFCIGSDIPRSFYGKFSDIEKYRGDSFCRCHNSYDVNLRYVRELTGTCFYMDNGAKIPISRNKFQDTKEQYFRFLDHSF